MKLVFVIKTLALPGGGANAVVQRYGAPAAHQALIRVHSAGAESGGSLSATAEAVIAAAAVEERA